jgi:DNA-directed RNA polymerase subunit M/transcription elongation factor TFIIS
MEVSFCKHCDNMLYLYADPDTSELQHGCKSCGNTEKLEDKSQFIYNNSQVPVDKSLVINSNPYITHDITLPRIQKNKNIKCNNELCDTEETDIVYIKYDNTNMRYIYICNHCGVKWKNNL